MTSRAQSFYPRASYRVSLIVNAPLSLGTAKYSATIEFPHTYLIESPTLPPGCEIHWSRSRIICIFSDQGALSIHFPNLTLLPDGSSLSQPTPAESALVRINGENCTSKAETTDTLVSLFIRSSEEQPTTEYDEAAHSKKYVIIGVSFGVAALILIAGCVVLRRNMTRASTVGLSRMRSVNKCGKLSGRTGRSSTSGEYEGPDAYKHYREKSLRRQEAVREFQNMVAEKTAAAAAAAAASSAGPSTARCSLNREGSPANAGLSQGIENDAYSEQGTCVVDLSQLTSPVSRQGTSREPSLHTVKIPSAYLFDDDLDPGEYFKQRADRMQGEVGGEASSVGENQDDSTERRVIWPSATQRPSLLRSEAGSPPQRPPSSPGRRRSTRYPWATSVHRPISISSSRSVVAAAVRAELRKAVSAEGMRVNRASMCRRCSVLSQRPRRLSARYPHRLSGHHPSQQQHHLQMHHVQQQQQQLLQQQEERQRQSRALLSEPIDVHTSSRPVSPPPRPMSPQAARLGCRTAQAYKRTNQHVLWIEERRGSHGLYGYI
ncbi:hypothetical protein EC968_007084 [Mortierella alpina]|nr:hypothetical protein EC968_007084 [Mortierella alpina]